MAKRESYINGVRMYSDVLDGESNNSKKQVNYYKRVEKTMTKTIIKEGDNKPRAKVVSTTIIKEGDNPEQISKKVYSSNNYANKGYEQNSKRFESSNNFKNVASGQQISKKINTSNINNTKYTGLKSSSQTVNYSSNYKTSSSQQKISQKIISSSNSKSTTYLANKGNIPVKNNYQVVKGNRSYSSSSSQQKNEKYGTVNEKNKYIQNSSLTREIAPVKQVTKVYKSQTVPKTKPVPELIIKNERTLIRIISHRKERTGRKEENYEYHESKDVSNKNKDTTVLHRRWGDPFYQIISDDRKKCSSYTSGVRGYKSNYSLNQKDYEVNSLSKGAKTIETESDKNSKYRNKTENKRIQIDTSKYKNSSSTNKYQIKTKSISSEKESQNTTNIRNNKNYGGNKYTSSYQRTINVEETRKKYGSKGRYEQSYTEGNVGRKVNTNIKSFSKDQKKNIPPSYKKFEEKTEETYKRGKRQFNQNINQKVFDTQKNKRQDDLNKKNTKDNQKEGKYIPGKYIIKKEETYKKTIISQKDKQDKHNQPYKKGNVSLNKEQNKNNKQSSYGQKSQNRINYPEHYQKQSVKEIKREEIRYDQHDMNDNSPQYPGKELVNDQGYQQQSEQEMREEIIYGQQDKNDNSPQNPGNELVNDQEYQQQSEQEMKEEVRYSEQDMNNNSPQNPGIELVNEQGYQVEQNEREEVAQIDNSQENRYEYNQREINICKGTYGDEADNYKFYESKNVTRKIKNVNSLNIQNNMNIEKNINILRKDNINNTRSGMGIRIAQGTQGIQGAQLYGLQSSSQVQGAQFLGVRASSGVREYDFPKVYIATKIIPVYSEIVNQHFQNLSLSHVCNVCGNPIEQGQIINSQQMNYNIRGQTMI